MPEIFYHTLTSLEDELLPTWLDLYETAFPPQDRILVSAFLRHLRNCQTDQGSQMLAAVGPESRLLGLAFYQLAPALRLMVLWYIAVDESQRGRGLGSLLYQEIVHRAVAAGCRALLFEVERPEICPTRELQALAERRIQFYRRNGARRLDGVDYLQSVGPHQPLTPMYLMLHAFDTLPPSDAFTMAKAIFGDQLCQVGELHLSA